MDPHMLNHTLGVRKWKGIWTIKPFALVVLLIRVPRATVRETRTLASDEITANSCARGYH